MAHTSERGLKEEMLCITLEIRVIHKEILTLKWVSLGLLVLTVSNLVLLLFR